MLFRSGEYRIVGSTSSTFLLIGSQKEQRGLNEPRHPAYEQVEGPPLLEPIE